nr:TIGR02301 family protein [Roseibium hamelinense]
MSVNDAFLLRISSTVLMMPPMRFAIFLLLAVCLATNSPASHAQTPQTEEPPYEQQLLRLSEVMGALHFLRPLCGSNDAPSWRQNMEALLLAEARTENRRRKFIERFNQGYRGFSAVYRVCTSTARTAMEQYIAEGETLITTVTSRYGR